MHALNFNHSGPLVRVATKNIQIEHWLKVVYYFYRGGLPDRTATVK